MCNLFEEKLGCFVLKINPSNWPTNKDWLIKWKHKLDIDDTAMFILRDRNGIGLKELVLAFNIIYINVYEMFVIDIAVEDCDREGHHSEAIRFRHESFQMYESSCTGLLLRNKFNDYVHINQMGLSIISLSAGTGDQVDKRVLLDDKGFQKTLHSLESTGHL